MNFKKIFCFLALNIFALSSCQEREIISYTPSNSEKDHQSENDDNSDNSSTIDEDYEYDFPVNKDLLHTYVASNNNDGKYYSFLLNFYKENKITFTIATLNKDIDTVAKYDGSYKITDDKITISYIDNEETKTIDGEMSPDPDYSVVFRLGIDVSKTWTYFYETPLYEVQNKALSTYIGVISSEYDYVSDASSQKFNGTLAYIVELDNDNKFVISFQWMNCKDYYAGTYTIDDEGINVTYDARRQGKYNADTGYYKLTSIEEKDFKGTFNFVQDSNKHAIKAGVKVEGVLNEHYLPICIDILAE